MSNLPFFTPQNGSNVGANNMTDRIVMTIAGVGTFNFLPGEISAVCDRLSDALEFAQKIEEGSLEQYDFKQTVDIAVDNARHYSQRSGDTVDERSVKDAALRVGDLKASADWSDLPAGVRMSGIVKGWKKA